MHVHASSNQGNLLSILRFLTSRFNFVCPWAFAIPSTPDTLIQNLCCCGVGINVAFVAACVEEMTCLTTSRFPIKHQLQRVVASAAVCVTPGSRYLRWSSFCLPPFLWHWCFTNMHFILRILRSSSSQPLGTICLHKVQLVIRLPLCLNAIKYKVIVL